MGNPWLAQMAKTRRENPDVKDFAKITELAKKTYSPVHHATRHHKKGGSAMGVVSPSEFKPDPKFPTSGADLQVYATNFSTGGGKKSRRSKSSKKSRKSGKKSRKSRSHKRR
jgi:hypothetical protein